MTLTSDGRLRHRWTSARSCLASIGDHPEAATNVQPYMRADGTRIWSLMQLKRQLRPEAYGRRRGGYIDRRRTLAGDT